MYLSPQQVVKTYRWSLAYVYKQARKHGWRRITLDGKVRYLLADVDRTYWACRDAAGVKSA
jgi:hypothetical protein